MKLLTLNTDAKGKRSLMIMRVIVFLTYVFKAFFVVDTQLNSYADYVSQFASFSGIKYFIIAFYGLFAFGIYWLFTSLTYGLMSKSKYIPVNDIGTIKFNRYTYEAHLAFVLIFRNLILGILNNLLYVFPVYSALVLTLAPIVITLLMEIALFLMLKKICGKGCGKELFCAMAFTNAIFIVVLI